MIEDMCPHIIHYVQLNFGNNLWKEYKIIFEVDGVWSFRMLHNEEINSSSSP